MPVTELMMSKNGHSIRLFSVLFWFEFSDKMVYLQYPTISMFQPSNLFILVIISFLVKKYVILLSFLFFFFSYFLYFIFTWKGKMFCLFYSTLSHGNCILLWNVVQFEVLQRNTYTYRNKHTHTNDEYKLCTNFVTYFFVIAQQICFIHRHFEVIYANYCWFQLIYSPQAVPSNQMTLIPFSFSSTRL